MRIRPDDETGEGNRKADQSYRKGVRETVDSTDADERAERARDVSRKDFKEASEAEDDSRSPTRE